MKQRFWIVMTFFSVFIFFSVLGLFAQEYKGQGRMHGVVYDEQSQPLEGVRVKLVYVKIGKGFDVKTDKEGKWVAAWLRGGTWHLDFEKIGYAPKKLSYEVQEYQRNPELKVTLKKTEGIVLSEDVRKLLEEGNKLFEQKQYDAARVIYEDILIKNPDFFLVNMNVGNCYFAQEKYDLAEQAFLKILEKEAGNAEAIVAVGNCYANRGDTSKAFEWYAKVEMDKIADPVVLYNIGTSYYNSARFDEAMKYYQRAVERNPDFADGLYQLGLTFLNLQKNADAITAFEKYLKIDSDSPRAAQVKAFLDYLRKNN